MDDEASLRVRFRALVNRHRALLLASATAGLSVLFFCPLELYLGNVSYESGPLVTLMYLAVVATLGIVVTSAIGAALPRRFVPYGVAILFWLSVGAWLQRNVSTSDLSSRIVFTELTEPPTFRFRHFPVDVSLWVIGLVLALVFARWVTARSRMLATFLVAVQALSVVVQVATGKADALWFNNGATVVDPADQYAFSRTQPNVVFLVLDATRSDVFADVIKTDPRYPERFSGFTLYRDTVSMYNSTQLALPGMLSGKYYDNKNAIEDYYKSAFQSDDFLLRIAQQEGYTATFNSFMSMYVFGDKERSLGQQVAEVARDGVVSRPVIKSTLMPIALMGIVPDSLKPLYTLGLIHKSVVRSDGWAMDAALARSVQAGLRITDRPTFHFYHIPGSHRPYLRNVNGKAKAAPHNYQAYFGHAGQAVESAAQILDALKQQGVYDNTTIVIVGDHGVPDQAPAIVPAPHLNPLIAVKPAQSHGLLAESQHSVSLADVQPYLARVLRAKGKPTAGFGETDDPVRQVATFDSRVFGRHFHDGGLTLRSYSVTGPASAPDSWRFLGQEDAGQWVRPASRPATYDSVHAGPDLGRGDDAGITLSGDWSLVEPLGVWTIGPDATIHIPTANIADGLQATFRLVVNATPGHPVRLDVSSGATHLASTFVEQSSATVNQVVTIPVVRPIQNSLDLDFHVSTVPYAQDPTRDTSLDHLGIFLQQVALARPTRYRLGDTLSFAQGGNAAPFQAGDWRLAEAAGSWSGPTGSLLLPLEKAAAGTLSVAIKGEASVPEGTRTVFARVNGTVVAHWDLRPSQPLAASFDVPSSLLQDPKVLDIAFACPDPSRPVNQGTSPDMERCLFVQSVTVSAR